MGNKKSSLNGADSAPATPRTLSKSSSLLTMTLTKKSSSAVLKDSAIIAGAGVYAQGKIPGYKDVHSFMPLPSLNKFVTAQTAQLATSLNATFLIHSDGHLYAFGYQQQGELGL